MLSVIHGYADNDVCAIFYLQVCIPKCWVSVPRYFVKTLHLWIQYFILKYKINMSKEDKGMFSI